MIEFAVALGTFVILSVTWPIIRRGVMAWHTILTESDSAIVRGVRDGLRFWRN